MVDLPVLSTSTALTLEAMPPNKTMASSANNKRPSSSGSDAAISKRQAITSLPATLSPVYESKPRPPSTTSSCDGPRSVFTNIPHEVLIMICRHVLVQTQGLKLQRQTRRPTTPTPAKPTTTTPGATTSIDAPRTTPKLHPLLAVLLTSRAMYFAGSEVYYGSNILRFSHPEHLRSCVPWLSIDARLSVRHIQLTVMWILTRRVPRSWRPWCDAASYASLRGCAKAFPKLRCLEFVCVGQSGSETSAWSEAEKRAFEKVVREKVKDFRFLVFTWRTNG